MNIEDKAVLEILNKLIASNRFNNTQILHVVKLAVISNDYEDLKDNIDWEDLHIKYKTNIKN